MTSLTPTHAELAIAVAQAEVRAAEVKLQLEGQLPSRRQAHLHDHRTAVAGDIADALDRIEPQLGTRWMQAMYPEVNLAEVER
jgi:hypothetical protein